MVLAVEPEIQRPSSVIHVRGVAGEIGARSAWTATPLEGKENRPPAPALWQARGKKSHLPVQFLRKPLRDITALVNVGVPLSSSPLYDYPVRFFSNYRPVIIC